MRNVQVTGVSSLGDGERDRLAPGFADEFLHFRVKASERSTAEEVTGV